jgi:hypothetical protein
MPSCSNAPCWRWQHFERKKKERELREWVIKENWKYYLVFVNVIYFCIYFIWKWNILTFYKLDNVQRFRELEGEITFPCVVLMYTHKYLRHKLYRNLPMCLCTPVYSCLFVDVCLIHSIKKTWIKKHLSKHPPQMLHFAFYRIYSSWL